MFAKRIAIAGGCRTPVARFGQRLREVPAQELLRVCFTETIRRSGISVKEIDEAVAGTCIHLPDALNVARVALLLSGCSEEDVAAYHEKGTLPRESLAKSATKDIPAYTVSRNCGSGLQAIFSATQEILSNGHEVVLAGGTESMSNSPGMIRRGGFNYRQRDTIIVDSLLHGLQDPLTGEMMGLTAEHVAEKYDISREQQDTFAAESHQKAFRALRSGKFSSQTVPVKVRETTILGNVRELVVKEDEGPDPSLTPAKLAGLKPYFKADGTVTPANSCMVNDGAASCMVLTMDKARELGIQPDAEILAFAVSAVDPSFMGEGPTSAIPKALKECGLTSEDIDIFEINESFAATTIAVQKSLGICPEKLNPHGGAIALGHPVGATGVILTVKAINILKEMEKETAVVSLCVGNGQGVALVIRNCMDTIQ
ncbi:MAG: thiolase family protein [Ignavibacteriales bacterium]|nr:thiolase family protein [Ignavibacteriales bacterium]